jgi:hypothetical protein
MGQNRIEDNAIKGFISHQEDKVNGPRSIQDRRAVDSNVRLHRSSFWGAKNPIQYEEKYEFYILLLIFSDVIEFQILYKYT